MTALLDRLEALARHQRAQFAGWFSELKSGMTYRLWEQGGYERRDDDEVALYTSECGLSHDVALKLIEVARAAMVFDAAVLNPSQPPGAFLALRAALQSLEKP